MDATGVASGREPSRGQVSLTRIAGLSALLAAGFCGMQIVIEVIGVGFMGIAVPTDVPGWYALLQKHTLLGLTELTALQIPAFALCVPVFIGVREVWHTDHMMSAPIASVFAFLGVGVYLASNTAFSRLHLSAKHAAATDVAQRTAIVAAGEAMLAVYQGVGVDVGLSMLMAAVVLVSVSGLGSGFPGKAAGWTGILATVLTIAYHVSSVFSSLAIFVLELAGLFFVIWLALLGRALLRYHPGRPIAVG